jgi:hypothetical protein
MRAALIVRPESLESEPESESSVDFDPHTEF